MRFKNIDLIKGGLIVVVIIGHILQGPLAYNIWRYLIYSFHMPLFVGMSGFLFDLEKIKTKTSAAIIKKYFFRIILPWLIAIIVYFFVSEQYDLSSINIINIIRLVMYPYYHLWFVAGFLSWITFTILLSKIVKSKRNIFFIAGVISVCAYILNARPFLHDFIPISNETIVAILQKFKPYLYVFFVYGSFFKEINKNIKKTEYLIPLLFLMSETVLFIYKPHITIRFIAFFVFNLVLLSLMLKLSINNLLPKSKLLEWIGRNSLGLYLWHVVPILIIKKLFGVDPLLQFYFLAVIGEVITIFIYSILKKNKILKKYMFGL